MPGRVTAEYTKPHTLWSVSKYGEATWGHMLQDCITATRVLYSGGNKEGFGWCWCGIFLLGTVGG